MSPVVPSYSTRRIRPGVAVSWVFSDIIDRVRPWGASAASLLTSEGRIGLLPLGTGRVFPFRLRGLNPLPSVSKTDALPDELNLHGLVLCRSFRDLLNHRMRDEAWHSLRAELYPEVRNSGFAPCTLCHADRPCLPRLGLSADYRLG